MATYTLFTDPHLGTRRAAHTTRESSKKLTTALYEQALSIVEGATNPVCLGDLFDRAANPEEIIVQGFNVASRCLITLAGNHDETNREGTVTSLRAIADMGVNICASKNLSVPYFQYDGGIFMVPHHASQELFEQAMRNAAAHAADERAGKSSVLMLHCNYDQPFAKEDDTLNLSPAVAEQLLVAFDYIFLGHEHKPSKHFDGRVVILGNTHPTSFSDISDKCTYHLDITDDSIELREELIWSRQHRFASLLYGNEVSDLAGVQFIDVIGKAEAEEAVDVADFIQKVWAAAPDALAVRNSVDVGKLALEDDAERPALVDIRQRIAADLEGSDLLDLYNELAREAVQ